MRTSTDSPCPTSITTNSASPCPGSPRSGHSSGSHNIRASGLPGTPRGNSSQNAPSKASGNANQRDSGSHHRARSLFASLSNNGQLRSKHHAAACQTQPPAPAYTVSSNRADQRQRHDHQAPPRDGDQVGEGPGQRRLSEQDDARRQQPERRNALRERKSRYYGRPRRIPPACGRHHNNQATPRKLSQKPAPNTANGSTSMTAIPASASASGARDDRR